MLNEKDLIPFSEFSESKKCITSLIGLGVLYAPCRKSLGISLYVNEVSFAGSVRGGVTGAEVINQKLVRRVKTFLTPRLAFIRIDGGLVKDLKYQSEVVVEQIDNSGLVDKPFIQQNLEPLDLLSFNGVAADSGCLILNGGFIVKRSELWVDQLGLGSMRRSKPSRTISEPKAKTSERYKKMQDRVDEVSKSKKYLSHDGICRRIAREFDCKSETIRRNTKLIKR